LNYIHSSLIVHRDLKPENFLFASKDVDSDIKAIDFGLSRVLRDKNQPMKTRAGTPYYIAPEVMANKYTLACDMWSAGVMLYSFLCGYPPFYGDDKAAIFEMVK
jgi:calcium-dependent protein kinase